MESVPAPTEEELARLVEEAKEKNKTLVMLNRLRNPRIQEQLLRVAQKHRGVFSREPEEILNDLRERIERESTVTHIAPKKKASRSFYSTLEDRAVIGVGKDKHVPTNEAHEYVESHEKGHAVRAPLVKVLKCFEQLTMRRDMKQGFSTFARAKERAFDLFVAGAVAYWLSLLLGPAVAAGVLARQVIKSSYLYSATEIYERMSQLKNYYGMEDDSAFTSAHLEYAREHFISDTEVDNHMSEFFKAITPKRQSEFLRIMNTYGV
jgi:hypothetical protein